jgi:predicted transposase YbfD/YdcC
VVLVGRERAVKGTNTSTAHYYITSLRGTAEQLGRLVRRHWSVENELHWVLDMAFGEDANRTAAGHAGVNLGLIRRVAASLLQQDPARGSIKAKRLSAAWDDGYMARALRGFTEN